LPHPQYPRRVPHLARSVWQSGHQRSQLEAETIAAALLVLVDFLPADQQAEGRRRVLAALRQLHDELGITPPPWLADG
jgi:hypothetical protein